MASDDLLMIAASQCDADMLYAVGMFVPDPFIYLRIGGRCHIVMNDTEIDRARRQAPHCRVISYSQCVNAVKRTGVKKVTLPHVVRFILQEKKRRKIQVPESFPLGLARQLRDLKIKVKLKKGPCFPERAVKCADEIKKISAALIMAEVGLSEAMLTLKNSKIARNGRLMHHNLPLTSEKLRSIIDTAILQAGGLAGNTIVAGGKQGCDPHERGHGRLRANEPIIIDIFPRSQKTGYFGDITRTVVKGRASETVRRIYHAVLRAQETAFEEMRPGVKGSAVHRAVQKLFELEGFKAGRKNGHMEGFFHGTGHGLGMEIHETPRMSATSEDVLRAGHIVTVEPGLYYAGIGGVRLEDVALVTTSGTRNLTKFEKNLEV